MWSAATRATRSSTSVTRSVRGPRRRSVREGSSAKRQDADGDPRQRRHACAAPSGRGIRADRLIHSVARVSPLAFSLQAKHTAQPQEPIVERPRAGEPTLGEEGLVLRIGASPQRARRRIDVKRLRRFALDREHERVRRAGRQLVQLRQQPPSENDRSGFTPHAGHLQVEASPAAVGRAEVRSTPSRTIGLVRELDPSICQQEMGDLQLGADVAQGVRVPASRSFFRILSRCASANDRKRADAASHPASSSAIGSAGSPTYRWLTSRSTAVS